MISRSSHYTVTQIAEIAGVHPETVRRWIRDGEIEASFTGRGTGGGYRIGHAEIERLVRARFPHLELRLPEEQARSE